MPSNLNWLGAQTIHDFVILRSLVSGDEGPVHFPAAEMLAEARRRGLDDSIALADEATLSWSQGDWAALRQLAQRVLAACATPAASDFLALATACRHLDDVDRAAEAAKQALALDPMLVDAAFIAAWAAAERGDGEAMLAGYRAARRATKVDPMISLRAE